MKKIFACVISVGFAAFLSGVVAQKIFLIPQDTSKPFEFQVFNERADTAVATFFINIF
jgi:hypothetical protein